MSHRFWKYTCLCLCVVIVCLAVQWVVWNEQSVIGSLPPNYLTAAREKTRITTEYFRKHPALAQQIFDDAFGSSQECMQTLPVGMTIDQWYGKTVEGHEPTCMSKVSSRLYTLRAQYMDGAQDGSMYFVKLGAKGTLQKLFLSGHLVSVRPETDGERTVVSFIDGKQSPLWYQFWHMGQDKEAFGFQSFIDARMHLLKDFPCETEIIVPVYRGDQMIGLVVYLYGT